MQVRLAMRMAVSMLILAKSLFAQPLPREQWGAPAVNVSHADGTWLIEGKKNKVTLDESDLALSVEAGPVTWAMVPSGPNDMLVRWRGEEFPLRLADARKVAIERYDTGYKTGVKITLSDWRRGGGNVSASLRQRLQRFRLLASAATVAATDLTLYLTVCLEGADEDLVFDIAAEEREAVVRRLDWPAALDSRDVDCTLLSNIRGVLLPRNWPKPYHPIRASNPDGSLKTSDVSEVQSNVIESWAMSWWGFQKGKSAMMIIVETPDDAAYQFEHPAGGTTVTVDWDAKTVEIKPELE